MEVRKKKPKEINYGKAITALIGLYIVGKIMDELNKQKPKKKVKK